MFWFWPSILEFCVCDLNSRCEIRQNKMSLMHNERTFIHFISIWHYKQSKHLIWNLRQLNMLTTLVFILLFLLKVRTKCHGSFWGRKPRRKIWWNAHRHKYLFIILAGNSWREFNSHEWIALKTSLICCCVSWP